MIYYRFIYFIWIEFVNSIIENPTFSSQTKDKHTTRVSEFGSKFIKFPFRNHEEPSQDDLDNVYERLYNSNLSELKKAKLYKNRFSLKDMFGIIKGEKVEKLFSQLALKALPKANYYYLNKGHYGLSYKYYCHFTSPIRRYPDILVYGHNQVAGKACPWFYVPKLMTELDLINQQELPQALLQVEQRAQEKYTMLQQ